MTLTGIRMPSATDTGQEYSFSGNTANEKSNYYFSIGYLDEKGYVTNSDFNRISARTSMSFTPKKWFKAGITYPARTKILMQPMGTVTPDIPMHLCIVVR